MVINMHIHYTKHALYNTCAILYYVTDIILSMHYTKHALYCTMLRYTWLYTLYYTMAIYVICILLHYTISSVSFYCNVLCYNMLCCDKRFYHAIYHVRYTILILYSVHLAESGYLFFVSRIFRFIVIKNFSCQFLKSGKIFFNDFVLLCYCLSKLYQARRFVDWGLGTISFGGILIDFLRIFWFSFGSIFLVSSHWFLTDFFK